jgi:hypothetical protein
MQISKNDLMSKLPYQLKLLLVALHNITLSTQALIITHKELSKELKWIYNSLQINFTPQIVEERLRELEQYAMVKIRKKGNIETGILLEVSTEEIRCSLEDN